MYSNTLQMSLSSSNRLIGTQILPTSLTKFAVKEEVVSSLQDPVIAHDTCVIRQEESLFCAIHVPSFQICPGVKAK